MPSISKKELDRFMKQNPDSEATQAIKYQLRKASEPETSTDIIADLSAGPGQIRNTASDLAAEKVNKLHHEILSGINSIFMKAIDIGEMLVNQKDSLKHGQWYDWVDNQLDIGPRQVQNYIKIYNRKEAVLESMNELAKTGIKPSIRKMLVAATKKDNQTIEDYLKSRKKNVPSLTPSEKKEQQKHKNRNDEISTLAKMYIAKEIDENSLRPLVLRWNRDNPGNYELFVEDVKKEARQIDKERHSDNFNTSPPDKTNIILSIDADLWESFVEFGGREVYLTEYISEFMTNYVIEQKGYRIAN